MRCHVFEYTPAVSKSETSSEAVSASIVTRKVVQIVYRTPHSAAGARRSASSEALYKIPPGIMEHRAQAGRARYRHRRARRAPDWRPERLALEGGFVAALVHDMGGAARRLVESLGRKI